MPRSFAITASTPSVQLNGSGQGEFTFTVSNGLGRPVRARAVLEPEGPLQRGWLTLVGEPEREFAPDGTQTFTVKVSTPPGAPEGSYSFHPVVVDVANPDEEFAIGPSVGFQVQRAVAPAKKKFPLWIALLAAGVLLITVGAITAGVLLRKDDSGAGGSGPAPTVALSFNGQNAYVDLGEPPALDFTGNVTIEAWIRPRTTGGFHNILAHGYSLTPPGELLFRILAGNYQVGSWNGMSHVVTAPIPPEDVGEWVHLAGVYDGAKWRLYRNGKEIASNPDPVGVLPVKGPWAIGARGGGSERFFDGDIAEVRLWKVARTPEQIQEDMRKDPKDDAPGLVGSWPLNEGRGTIAGDRSEQSQAHGVLRGPTWNTR
ncbi:LamG-like jellyroll fold domain-containing protein [Hyalangium sp.]|uniref:LamG-like jellyroll fold domain-containing protein n=1 Tax=Hyalangium sp. TaxID=2028555 RepID=UPI002D648EC2|nr:LamG-like jellyroll fold domain-containing protein [Hyalangium sp.]HYH95165.1 LamG-like jellyroll fold domain-containing protein [Hyalangium sp.]